MFDAPPLLSGADALPLLDLVDYVLVVVQAGKTSVDDLNGRCRPSPRSNLWGWC